MAGSGRSRRPGEPPITAEEHNIKRAEEGHTRVSELALYVRRFRQANGVLNQAGKATFKAYTKEGREFGNQLVEHLERHLARARRRRTLNTWKGKILSESDHQVTKQEIQELHEALSSLRQDKIKGTLTYRYFLIIP